ncbi:MAG: hypothetical protein U0586_16905 [Candidatus Brocadiaceae bacterium]
MIKKMSKLVFIVFLLALTPVLITGCASTGGLSTSLEDLNTEYQKKGFTKVPEYRVVSVSGLLPSDDVGRLFFYKPKRGPSSAIGLSNNEGSFILESIIEDSGATDKDLIETRNKLAVLLSKAADLIAKRINLKLVSDRTPPDTTAIKVAQESYDNMTKEFNTLHQEIVEKVHVDGIIIARWSTNTEKSGSLNLGKYFGGSSSKNESYNGFALMRGLRTATLFVGKDLCAGWSNLDKSSSYGNRFVLTTYVMQTKQILYVSAYDFNSQLKANLDASYKQLADPLETLKKLDQIEIETVLSKISSLSNMGMVGGVKRREIPVDFNPKPNPNPNKTDDWQTFLSVETNLKDMIDMVKPPPERM